MNDKVLFIILTFIVQMALRISYISWCILLVFWLLDYQVGTIEINNEKIVVIKYMGKEHKNEF